MTNSYIDNSRPRHPLLMLTTAILLSATLTDTMAAEETGEPESRHESGLPEGEGRDLTIARCTDGCHEPSIVAIEGLSPDEWVEMIEWMIGLGASISDEEFNTIYAYVTKAYPET